MPVLMMLTSTIFLRIACAFEPPYASLLSESGLPPKTPYICDQFVKNESVQIWWSKRQQYRQD